MNSQLVKLVESFPKSKVLLVGDLMLDRYVFGDAERISPEAPVPVLRIVDRQDRVGGAGSVALNLASLGAESYCCGLVGNDIEGKLVLNLLADAGVKTDSVIQATDRPTITKTRMVGLAEHRHRQQIMRVDDEVIDPPSEADAKRIVETATKLIDDVDVVCLEDYAKGLLSPEICQAIITVARERNKPVLVDPARGGKWEKYRGVTVLKPNRVELEMAAGRPVGDDEIAEVGAAVIRDLDVKAMLITLGREGALLVQADGPTLTFPTKPRAVYDNTGAGDAVLAMTAVALAAGGTMAAAVQLANVAGGLEVSKFGCVPITRNEVVDDLNERASSGIAKIKTVDDLVLQLTGRREHGETIVFTNGCFDILHPGHIEILEKSKALGSVLVVGVNSDASVRSLGKGDDRPIRREHDRMRMLAALEAVDYVVKFDEPDPGKLIEQVVPDVLIKGADWAGKGVIGQEFVESHGGRVELIELVEGYSTTGELEKIRKLADKAGQ